MFAEMVKNMDKKVIDMLSRGWNGSIAVSLQSKLSSSGICFTMKHPKIQLLDYGIRYTDKNDIVDISYKDVADTKIVTNQGRETGCRIQYGESGLVLSVAFLGC